MLFGVERETRFDLRFRLFGTPIRVTPWFWVTAVFFGWGYIRIGVEYLMIWVACVFFSILLHEFGHIWMGRIFGARGEIVLQGMCGLAIGVSEMYQRWKRVCVSLAGPGIQFLFVFLLLLALNVFGQPKPMEAVDSATWFDRLRAWMTHHTQQPRWPEHLQRTVYILISINLFWAILNLVPVWPLDGGKVSREFFTWVAPRNGVRGSLAVSIASAILLCVNSVLSHIGGPTIPYVPQGDIIFIFFFAALAFQSFQLFQIENTRHTGNWRDPDDEARLPWENDPDEWKRR